MRNPWSSSAFVDGMLVSDSDKNMASVNDQPPGTLNTFTVFDRERDHHPWQEAFQELQRPDLELRWAVAANWRMDHRVSEDRERDDLDASGHFASVRDANDWWEARKIYFQQEICQPIALGPTGKISAYGRQANAANRIADGTAPFDRLVHVGSLGSMLRWVSRGSRSAEAEAALNRLTGQTLLSKRDPLNAQVSALARAMLALGPEVVRRIAGLLADSLGEQEPPWWACFTEEVRTALNSRDALALCAALGLGHLSAGDWLLVWRYPIQEAGPLYRPTVLEANDSPFHFPSPPGYALGITMPLDPAQAACREVLHRPLRGRAAVGFCTGELFSLEGFPVLRDNAALSDLRTQHRARLEREFPSAGLKGWVQRHPEITL